MSSSSFFIFNYLVRSFRFNLFITVYIYVVANIIKTTTSLIRRIVKQSRAYRERKTTRIKRINPDFYHYSKA